MKFTAACLQLTSNDQPKENLDQVLQLSEQAIKEKVDFILTPENTFLLTLDHEVLLKRSETYDNSHCIEGIKKFSKNNSIWFLIGATPINIDNQIYNRSILINPEGEIVSHYDKIHMFDVNLPNGESYKESDKFQAGKEIILSKLPWANLGHSICYDLRFPNHYRQLMKKGADLLTVPSAFTKNTGERHWHILLRSRAIENFCYVLAPAQTGKHFNGRETYGHSLIISPDGKILAEKENGIGFIVSEIDTEKVKKIRSEIPSTSLD
ncbi:carbon-nitrogen hydrolase family protein [Pelagibacteraceae bacterium]|nr:carbon-nitrogen hydrolase family protein [Pelagibacteraceae bacterium]